MAAGIDRGNDAHYLRHLIDQVPAMLSYWDKQLRCRFANRAYAAWFGIEPQDLIGKELASLLGTELFEKNRPHVMAALAGEPQTFERILQSRHGEQRHSLANYLPDVVDGEVIGFLAQITDVARLKDTEAALRASEALLDRTGRIASVGGWETDLVTKVVTWSNQTCRIHGVPNGYQPTAQEAFEFVDEHARAPMQAAVEASMEHGTHWDMELPVTTVSGRRIWVRAIGEVERKDGVPVKLVGAIQDITEQVHNRDELAREQALRAQLEHQARELRALLSERSDMLDVLAHEVRQPLNNASSALQSAQAALANVHEQVATPRLARAQAVMTQVMASIDNTLAVAALLIRADPIHMQDTDIDTLVAVAIGDMSAADRPRVQIQRITTTRTAAMDMSLMRLALRNLLANALKYSTAGSPVVVRLYDSDDPLALIIEVENTGHRIPEQLLPVLFERGTRGRQVDNSGTAGHGLGLYIVKRVMELHGGRVELAYNTDAVVSMRLVVVQTDS
ncbi:MAG: PAS domain-containing protein [Aquabacterium sp.]